VPASWPGLPSLSQTPIGGPAVFFAPRAPPERMRREKEEGGRKGRREGGKEGRRG
jgi:hypothetical protein